jgi:hypothetical protein
MPRSPKPDDVDRVIYPISEADHPERVLSIDSLMAAENHDLVTFRKPYDLSAELDVDALREELGPKAVLPDHNGVVYLFYITPADQRGKPKTKPVPVLIAEGHVKDVMLGIALALNLEAAQNLLYRQALLPLHDPLAGQK